MRKNSILKSILCLSFGFISLGAMAQQGAQQGPGNQQELVARQTERLKQQLELTSEQVTKLDEINNSSIEAMLALRNDQSIAREAKMDKMKAMRLEREAAIKAMLTAEQLQKYEAMQQNQENRQAQRQQGRRRGTK